MPQERMFGLHQQETDFKIVEALLPYVKYPTFLDIGAEKGTFSQLLIDHQFTGIFFEPLPKHSVELKALSTNPKNRFSAYAIDKEDRTADFFIACDPTGTPLDYFHSLNFLSDDDRIQHQQKITVNCRSLNSLLAEGMIEKNIGVVKTDTEGNDLHVLMGASDIKAEILVCEFFMPGIYSGWEQGDPYALITEAKKLGFNHYISIKRIDHFEFVSIDSTAFLEKNWGNLIFLTDEIFAKATPILHQIIAKNEIDLTQTITNRTSELKAEIDTLQNACEERLALINRLHYSHNQNPESVNSQLEKIYKKIEDVESFNNQYSLPSLIDAKHVLQDHVSGLSRIQNILAEIISKQNQNYKEYKIQSDSKLSAEFNTLKDLHINQLNTCATIQESLERILPTLQSTEFILHNYMSLMKKIQTSLTNLETSSMNNFLSLQEQMQKLSNTMSGYHEKTLVERLKKIYRRFFKKSVNKFKSNFDFITRPRLGELCLHEPKPIKLPKRYRKEIYLTSVPSISIVTPSYNHAAFLERTINSVVEQNYSNLEYIIQDGGSIDSTIEILQKYATKLKHWNSTKDNGQTGAINTGFQQATGDIMAYLNSDDILLPGSLQYVGKYFHDNPDVDVIYSHRILIDQNNDEIGRWILPKHDTEILSWADYIPQETLFWRRQIWDKVGGKLDESFRFAMDWDLILRFREVNAKFVRVPRFLGAFRIHPEQKTSTQILHIGDEEMQRLRLRCHGRDVSRAEISAAIKKYLNRHLVFNHFYKAGILRY